MSSVMMKSMSWILRVPGEHANFVSRPWNSLAAELKHYFAMYKGNDKESRTLYRTFPMALLQGLTGPAELFRASAVVP